MTVEIATIQVRRQRRQSMRMRLTDLATWIVALSLVGYPLLGTLVAFTSLPSLIASVPVRVVVLALSLLLIFKAKKPVLGPFSFQIIFLFWLLYLVRLLWDMFIAEIPAAADFMLSFLIFSSLPSLALMHTREINEQQLIKLLLALGTMTCVLAILAGYTSLAGARSFTEQSEGRLFLDTVNPITYGHIGVTTLLAALSKSRQCNSIMEWTSVGTATGLGLMTIQLSGSRGPLLSLFICITALAVFNKQYRWFFAPLMIIALMFFSGLFADSENLLASRLTSSVQSDNSEARLVMQAAAIQQFLDNPIFGSAIIEMHFQDYPHNIFVESAMALGISGLLLFILIAIAALRGIAKKLKSGTLILPLLALQYFSAAQFSGSIAASNAMWILFALLVFLREKKSYKANANNETRELSHVHHSAQHIQDGKAFDFKNSSKPG